MPNKASAKKALRQDDKKAIRNLDVKNKIRFQTRRVKKNLKIEDIDTAKTNVKDLIKSIDKAAQKGILKKNTAARKKSRIMKRINKAEK